MQSAEWRPRRALPGREGWQADAACDPPKTEFSGQYPLDQPEEIGDGIAYHAALTAGLQFIEDILTLLLRQLTQRRLNILLLPGLDADQAGWQLHGTGFFVFARAVRTFLYLYKLYVGAES